MISEVFKVENWHTKKRPDKYGKLYNGYGFNGIVAEESIRIIYVNKSIKGVKPIGYGYPVVYPETFREWLRNKKEN